MDRTDLPDDKRHSAKKTESGAREVAVRRTRRPVAKVLKVLGPGLITGVADEDPATIGTCATVGASLGYGMLWALVATVPLMAAVQFMAAKIGQVNTAGLAAVIRRHFPAAVLYPLLAGLTIANTINAGVDLGAMGEAVALLVPAVPSAVFVLLLSGALLALQFWGTYRPIREVFKWLSLSLAAYLVNYAIVLAAAATLHRAGHVRVDTAAQLAESLQPLAGRAAAALLAVGLLGTGMLAVPVLTTSAAYALAEAFHWKRGLDLRPTQAFRFYAVIAAATLIGMAMNFVGFSAVQALFWTSLLYGFLAPPVLLIVVVISGSKAIMGSRADGLPLRIVGWLSVLLTVAAVIGLLITVIAGAG